MFRACRAICTQHWLCGEEEKSTNGYHDKDANQKTFLLPTDFFLSLANSKKLVRRGCCLSQSCGLYVYLYLEIVSCFALQFRVFIRLVCFHLTYGWPAIAWLVALKLSARKIEICNESFIFFLCCSVDEALGKVFRRFGLGNDGNWWSGNTIPSSTTKACLSAVVLMAFVMVFQTYFSVLRFDFLHIL